MAEEDHSITTKLARWSVPAGAVLLGLVCIWQSLPGLEPPSFWLDDLWVATLAKFASLSKIIELKPPAPFGFLVIEKTMLAVFGQHDWPLQILALVSRAAAVTLIVLLVKRLTGKAVLGLAAGAVLAFQPEITAQAVRTKQYCLDVLLTTAVLWGGALCAEKASLKRLGVFAASVFGGLFFSFTLVFVGPLMVNVSALDLLLRAERGRRLSVFSVALAFDAAVGAFAWFVLHATASPQIQNYWNGKYVPNDSLRNALDYVWNDFGWGFLTGVLPEHRTLGFGLMVIAVVVLLWRRETRYLGVFVLLFYPQVFIVSSQRYLPLGVPRIDSFSWPIPLVTACMGAAFLIRWMPRVDSAVGAVAIASYTIFQLLTHPTHYTDAGEQQMVRALQTRLTPEGTPLVVHPWSNWALSYYGSWPTELVTDDYSTARFFTFPKRENTLVLRETYRGIFTLTHRELIQEVLTPFLANAGHRVVYFGAVRWQEIVVEALRAMGWHEVHREQHATAIVAVLER